MEEIEQGQETVRRDVDQMKGKMDQIHEALQAMVRRGDNPQQTAAIETVTLSHPPGFTVYQQQDHREIILFPIYDLPFGYTLP